MDQRPHSVASRASHGRHQLVRQLASAAGFGASVELEAGRNIPLSSMKDSPTISESELDDFVGRGKGRSSHLRTSGLAFATICSRLRENAAEISRCRRLRSSGGERRRLAAQARERRFRRSSRCSRRRR